MLYFLFCFLFLFLCSVVYVWAAFDVMKFVCTCLFWFGWASVLTSVMLVLFPPPRESRFDLGEGWVYVYGLYVVVLCGDKLSVIRHEQSFRVQGMGDRILEIPREKRVS